MVGRKDCSVIEPVDFEVLRYSSQHDSTLGLLFRIRQKWEIPAGSLVPSIIREWLCHTLEDEYRTVKLSGETRIPAGRYQLTLRTIGPHHTRYRYKFPDIHKGMIEMLGVHGFSDILMHIGNREDQTGGCLLVGSTAEGNIVGPGRIGSSTSAYLRVYPIMATMIERRPKVFIRYVDFDTVEEKGTGS